MSARAHWCECASALLSSAHTHAHWRTGKCADSAHTTTSNRAEVIAWLTELFDATDEGLRACYPSPDQCTICSTPSRRSRAGHESLCLPCTSAGAIAAGDSRHGGARSAEPWYLTVEPPGRSAPATPRRVARRRNAQCHRGATFAVFSGTEQVGVSDRVDVNPHVDTVQQRPRQSVPESADAPAARRCSRASWPRTGMGWLRAPAGNGPGSAPPRPGGAAGPLRSPAAGAAPPTRRSRTLVLRRGRARPGVRACKQVT